jgi:type I restriction enzyme S subunit
VKPGYKQTEVGVIPEDWEVKLLPEVTHFRGGKAHEQHISDAGPYVCVNSKFISSEGKVRKYATANFCSAKKGDVLMVMSDLPNGKALAKAFLADRDNLYAVNQRVCALTAYRNHSSGYLFYALNRNPYFLKFDDGVSQTHLLNNVFRKCPLPLPPTLAEQEAIAGALSDADALIDSLEQLIAKKRLLKQGAMQDLLTGKKRLPGFEGEWEVKTLREIGKFKNGLNKDSESFGHGSPFVNLMDVFGTPSRAHHGIFPKTGICLSETRGSGRSQKATRALSPSLWGIQMVAAFAP